MMGRRFFSYGKIFDWHIMRVLDRDEILLRKRGKRGGRFEYVLRIKGDGIDAVRSVYEQFALAEFRFLLRECGLAIKEMHNESQHNDKEMAATQ